MRILHRLDGSAAWSWRWVYVGLAVATIAAGLVLRLAHLGLPFPVVKWGGSVLWAWMVYWIAAACLPGWRPWSVAGFSAVFAALVELIRLVHFPALDGFRGTLAGMLLLGRVFSWWHFAVYWAAIGLAAVVDRAVVRQAAIRKTGMGPGWV